MAPDKKSLTYAQLFARAERAIGDQLADITPATQYDHRRAARSQALGMLALWHTLALATVDVMDRAGTTQVDTDYARLKALLNGPARQQD
jgi:hypothetical protein